MFIIGITGNISSGKSTVARILADIAKTPIVDTDKIIHELIEPNKEALVYIAANFGEEMIRDDGELDKEKLDALITISIEARIKLNNILFPLIRKRVLELFNMYSKAGNKYLVYDAPLLFENGTVDLVDYITVVYVPQDIQIKRIQENKNLTIEQATAMVNSHTSGEEFLKRKADYLITNISNFVDLNVMISELWKNIRTKKKK